MITTVVGVLRYFSVKSQEKYFFNTIAVEDDFVFRFLFSNLFITKHCIWCM